MRADIVQTFLDYNKYAIKEGPTEGNSAFMPYLVMDVAYQIFTKEVTTVPLRHQLAHWKKEWLRQYKKFNARFFEAFDVDQTDYIIDQMDKLEEDISEDVETLKGVFVNGLEDLVEGEKQVCCGCLMCNILTQAAQVFWMRCYKGVGMEVENHTLVEIQRASFKLMNLCYSGSRHISFNNSTEAEEVVNQLCKAIVNWSMVTE